jgi:hypothetical protein
MYGRTDFLANLRSPLLDLKTETCNLLSILPHLAFLVCSSNASSDAHGLFLVLSVVDEVFNVLCRHCYGPVYKIASPNPFWLFHILAGLYDNADAEPFCQNEILLARRCFITRVSDLSPSPSRAGPCNWSHHWTEDLGNPIRKPVLRLFKAFPIELLLTIVNFDEQFQRSRLYGRPRQCTRQESQNLWASHLLAASEIRGVKIFRQLTKRAPAEPTRSIAENLIFSPLTKSRAVLIHVEMEVWSLTQAFNASSQRQQCQQ